MEPCHCLATQDLRHLDKASQVNTLTPCDHHLLLHNTTVTHTHRAVGHILQQPANTVVTETQQNSLDASDMLCLHNEFNFNLCIQYRIIKGLKFVQKIMFKIRVQI